MDYIKITTNCIEYANILLNTDGYLIKLPLIKNRINYKISCSVDLSIAAYFPQKEIKKIYWNYNNITNPYYKMISVFKNKLKNKIINFDIPIDVNEEYIFEFVNNMIRESLYNLLMDSCKDIAKKPKLTICSDFAISIVGQMLNLKMASNFTEKIGFKTEINISLQPKQS